MSDISAAAHDGPTGGTSRGAAELLRGVGLRADGPVVWGSPVRSSLPGVYLVELAAPWPSAPIDQQLVRAWLERLPNLRLDGARPTVADLTARLASFWLPDQVVLYIGSTAKSIGGRVAAYTHTALGERRPHATGQWLKTLRGFERTRIWWAETEMPEEYEDALLDAFVAGVPAETKALLPPGAPVLPFAVTSRAAGERRLHGITGSIAPEEPAPPPTHVEVLEPAPDEPVPDPIRAARSGGFSPAWSSASPNRGRPAAQASEAAATPRARAARATAPKPSGPASGARARKTSPPPAVGRTPGPPAATPVYVSESGLEQLKAELDDLVTVKRPAILARIVAARELGDLRENGDYEAARKEQSFAEGRIQAIEALLRNAVPIAESEAKHKVSMGSTIVVDSRHGTETFTIVGSAEADAHQGRISYSSPIGRALMGHVAGDKVTVRVPAGAIDFHIVEVG